MLVVQNDKDLRNGAFSGLNSGLNRQFSLADYATGGCTSRATFVPMGNSMTRWLSRILAFTGVAMALAMLAAPAQAEKRVALVIGNNDYKNVPKLQKAVNDARTMGDTLKQLGFTVMVAENQTRQAFSQSLLAFDKAVEKGDTAFFFYAGHGFEIAGQNFLLPTDVPAATEGQEELVRDASILADRIIQRLQNKAARRSSYSTPAATIRSSARAPAPSPAAAASRR